MNKLILFFYNLCKREKTTCPRRMNELGPFPKEENLDYWEYWKSTKYRQCSFCGCVHPDDVTMLLRTGSSVGRTDKNYKMYLYPKSGGMLKIYFQHFTKESYLKFNETLASEKTVIK